MLFNRCKKRIGSFFLVLALVGSGLLAAFHHHEAAAKDPEHCATCHLGQQAKLGNLEAAPGLVSTPDFFQELPFPAAAPKLIASFFLLGKFSQAPPRA
ncbi:MAG TPA: hypothetical protein VJR29_00180 [bacterium]|nr:hypothetical protein [bacterium]